MVKRSVAEIEFGIMQAVKRGSDDGEAVNAWYITRDVGISYSTFKKHADFLFSEGYLTKDNREYGLTEEASKVISYFKKKEVLEKLSTPESVLESLSSNCDDFKPNVIMRTVETPPRSVKRTPEELMFDFIKQVKSSGERGSIPSNINAALMVSPGTVINCGNEAEKNGYVFSIQEVKGGNIYRKYFTTPEGEKWLTNTPEKMFLSKIDY